MYMVGIVPELIRGDIVPHHYNIVSGVLFFVIWFFTCVMHLVVAYMDPGIMPREEPPPVGDDPYRAALNAPPQSKQVTVNGASVTMKLCGTCNAYRPPRTIHCGVCNNCVQRFDHHCPYIGNCVGLRNYRFFLCFIFGVFLTALLALSHCLALIIMRVKNFGWQGGFDISRYSFIFAWILCVLCVLALLLVGALVFWTSYLISIGRTTYERMKQEKQLTPNPYNRGIFANWFYVCCPPQYPASVYPRRHLRKASASVV